MKSLILYTMEGCPYCEKIKREFANRGIKYEEREINSFREEFLGLRDRYNFRTVPAALIGEKMIVGSDKVDEMEKELNS